MTTQTIRNWIAVGRLRSKKLAPFQFQVVNAADVERERQGRVDA